MVMKACVLFYIALSLSVCFLWNFPRPLFADTLLRVAYENKTQFPYYMGDTSKVLAKPGAAVELVKLLEEQVPCNP